MKSRDYKAARAPMREELAAMARWAQATGQRIVVPGSYTHLTLPTKA